MIRIRLFGGDTIDTHLHTREQVIKAKNAGTSIAVGGPEDTWYGPEDELPDDTFDRNGIHPQRTIPASAIAGVEEVDR